VTKSPVRHKLYRVLLTFYSVPARTDSVVWFGEIPWWFDAPSVNTAL